MMKIRYMDHLVLTVRDIDATLDFYTRALGMEAVVFQGNRKALRFGDQKINLHQYGEEFDPKALQPSPGSADLCFIVDGSLDDVVALLRAQGVEILDEPRNRSGALGPIQSIYVRDPDGNLIELSRYES